jgi:hypothetical protein
MSEKNGKLLMYCILFIVFFTIGLLNFIKLI